MARGLLEVVTVIVRVEFIVLLLAGIAEKQKSVFSEHRIDYVARQSDRVCRYLEAMSVLFPYCVMIYLRHPRGVRSLNFNPPLNCSRKGKNLVKRGRRRLLLWWSVVGLPVFFLYLFITFCHFFEGLSVDFSWKNNKVHVDK